jgi:hypothetical protein
MLFSRQIAKRRIARQERPGFMAAWSLVLLDGALIMAVLWLLWGPVTTTLAGTLNEWVFYGLLFVIFFVPIQVVLITSAIWAVYARWQDQDTTN